MKPRIFKRNLETQLKGARSPQGTENIWHEFWKLRETGTVPAIRAHASLTQPEDASRQFIAETGSGHHVVIDDSGQAGPTPIELIAAALAGCVGCDLIATVRANHQTITGYEVRVEAEQAERSPRALVVVRIHHVFRGRDLDAAAIAAAVGSCEQRDGVIEAMLKHTASVETTFEIVDEPHTAEERSGEPHENVRGGHQNLSQEHPVHH